MADMVTKTHEALANHPFYQMMSVAVGYLFGNPITFLVLCSLLGAFNASDVFKKPRHVNVIGLGIFSILGLQAIVLCVQTLMENLTGLSGINETMANNMSFNGNPVQTAVLIIYMVIVAPVTEEMPIKQPPT